MYTKGAGIAVGWGSSPAPLRGAAVWAGGVDGCRYAATHRYSPARRCRAKALRPWASSRNGIAVGESKRVGCANMHHDGVAKRDLSWAWVHAKQ
jgi:hypothetical protein